MHSFIEKFYTPNARRFFEWRGGAEDLTVQDLIDFCRNEGIHPERVSVSPECDADHGPEGPDEYIQIDWKK